MFNKLVKKKCPDCGKYVVCDLHDCGCIFGHCDNCNTDFEFDDNCKGE